VEVSRERAHPGGCGFTHQLSIRSRFEIFLSRQAIVCVVFPVFAIVTEESVK
jgi:hypothetical protein